MFQNAKCPRVESLSPAVVPVPADGGSGGAGVEGAAVRPPRALVHARLLVPLRGSEQMMIRTVIRQKCDIMWNIIGAEFEIWRL